MNMRYRLFSSSLRKADRGVFILVGTGSDDPLSSSPITVKLLPPLPLSLSFFSLCGRWRLCLYNVLRGSRQQKVASFSHFYSIPQWQGPDIYNVYSIIGSKERLVLDHRHIFDI
jgi:hypothetical protein